jgi:cytoskeletal protein RodZ
MLINEHTPSLSTFQSPGRLLKAARLHLGWSQEEISWHSKIPLYAIQAIESDDWDALPGLIYVKGFLRLYAREVALDPEMIIQCLEASFIEHLAYEEMKNQDEWSHADSSILNLQALMSLMAGVAVAVLIISLFGVRPQTLEAKETSPITHQLTSTLP